jgi:hypothetical protein
MPVEQIGGGHAAEIRNDDRNLVRHQPVEGDPAEDIHKRGSAACEHEQNEAVALRAHRTLSAISRPKRTLSEMPRSSG